MESNDQQQRPSRTTTIILVIALLASLAGNLYQYNKGQTTVTTYESRVDTLESARTEIETELNATYAELEKYKGQNKEMDSVLREAHQKVDDQKTRINQILRTVKNKEELNKRLQAELADLRKVKDEYIDRVDSLMVANQRLLTEKNDLNTRVDSLNRHLETTVSTASVLKAEYIKANTFKKRGNGKYSETLIAKRTNKVDVQFKILENAIAKAGEKAIYMRIVEPGGKVLGNKSEGSNMVKINGQDVLYTASTKVQYANAGQDVTLSWEEPARNFVPGTYTVEIYVDDKLAGTNTFTLK